MVPGKMIPAKMVPGKMVPEKMVPGNLVPRKLKNEKSWGGRRASWSVCVCGMLGCDQSMKTQNSETKPKPETKNRELSVEHRGVCVWNVRMWSIYEDPKLDNKSSWTSWKSSVLPFGTYVGSWRKRQTFFFVCVVESIDKNEKVV